MNTRNEVEAMNIIINIQAMQDIIHGEHFLPGAFRDNTVDELRILQGELIPLYNKKLAEKQSMPVNYSFNQNDNNYADAVNYDGTDFRNCPMTFEINGVLFILPFGSMDSKQVKRVGDTVYIVAGNTGLNYISMVVIDLSDNSTQSCYLGENDLSNKENSCYGILDKELDKQIKILSDYIY